MSTENAEENDPNVDGADSAELDDAIDGLRDVLKQDSEGLDLSSSEAGAEPDLGADLMSDLDADFGSDIGGDIGGDLGGDIGADFAAGGDLGSDIGGDIGGDIGSDFGGDIGGDFAGGGDFGGDIGGDLGGGAGLADSGLGDMGGGSAVTGATGTQTRADLVLDIPVEVQVVLGTSRLQVAELMDLTEGATIGLERKIGEPVEIMVNGKLIGRGEITVLENDDTKFGVKMIEVMGSKSNSG